jgi:hypothetical protein
MRRAGLRLVWLRVPDTGVAGFAPVDGVEFNAPAARLYCVRTASPHAKGANVNRFRVIGLTVLVAASAGAATAATRGTVQIQGSHARTVATAQDSLHHHMMMIVHHCMAGATGHDSTTRGSTQHATHHDANQAAHAVHQAGMNHDSTHHSGLLPAHVRDMLDTLHSRLTAATRSSPDSACRVVHSTMLRLHGDSAVHMFMRARQGHGGAP